MNEPNTLHVRQRELIAVGAAIGGNCLPCLRYHFPKAVKAGCVLEEIAEAIELAKMVKERPDQGHLSPCRGTSAARTRNHICNSTRGEG